MTDLARARWYVLAVGILNLLKLPAIPGMDDFEGDAFHSARWDYSVTGGAPGQLAVVFEGQGQASVDYAGGVLNLPPGSRRVASVTLDGNGAATIPIGYGNAQPGAALTFQVLFRDPADPVGLGLTGGLRVDVCD